MAVQNEEPKDLLWYAFAFVPSILIYFFAFG
jgi:hypothetical protein